ncbi:MAG: hypothetical protein EXX96DRAFT_482636 [Benjaminiella poitrasii]|nr:MAG: hypothetical protein EXX96DRAFT_482636 [Benjaminiella poitrasii]
MNKVKISRSSLLERWLILSFRKIRMIAYINEQYADAKLIRYSKQAFVDSAVLVFGNWSALNIR